MKSRLHSTALWISFEYHLVDTGGRAFSNPPLIAGTSVVEFWIICDSWQKEWLRQCSRMRAPHERKITFMEPNRPDSVERFELVPITLVSFSVLKSSIPKNSRAKKRRLIYNEHQKQRNDGALHGRLLTVFPGSVSVIALIIGFIKQLISI